MGSGVGVAIWGRRGSGKVKDFVTVNGQTLWIFMYLFILLVKFPTAIGSAQTPHKEVVGLVFR